MAVNLDLDQWQQEVLEYQGNITIRAGRQVGKSTIIGKKAADLLVKYPGCSILIVAPAQRQSGQLFEKVISWLQVEHEKELEKAGGFKENPALSIRRNQEMRRAFEIEKGIYSENPTKTTIKLKNGSVCYSLPAGKTGIYLRSYSLDFLIIDEAAYVPDAVYTALKPMLAVSAQTKGLGWEILLSTPFGKGGFFYDSHVDDTFRQWHINSEKCKRIPREFLRKEKQRLSKIEYAQEYLGEFVDEFNQFFPTDLIKQRMTFINWEYEADYDKTKDYFLGVDIARYGADENAFVIAEMDQKKRVKIVKVKTTTRVSLIETAKRILAMHESYNFNRIFIDDAGVGAGVYDYLVDQLGSRKRVMAMNNSSKSQEKDGRVGRILKEDLYSNAAVLMERNLIDIISSLKLQKSLRSMTFTYNADRNVKIFGSYSHLAEAFVRACWCVKAKSLNLFLV